MAANVGLSTPRGSGTSGYVQRSLSHLKSRDNYKPYSRDADEHRHKPRKPDQKILDHDRLRAIEVKVFELRDKLEDEEVEEDEIEMQTNALRTRLLAEDEAPSGRDERVRNSSPGRRKQFKVHQVHEQAQAKIVESEKLRRALGISKDYEEGGHWRAQEQRLKEGLRRSED